MLARRTWELAVYGAKKIVGAAMLFGFSQHRMHFCDLRLRHCQTSNLRFVRELIAITHPGGHPGV
jgi:hypothetical protein